MASPPWCARRCAPIRSPGVVYVFRAKRADRVKLLYWDGLEAADLPLRLKRKLKSRHNPIPSPDPPRTLSDQANAGQVPPEHRLTVCGMPTRYLGSPKKTALGRDKFRFVGLYVGFLENVIPKPLVLQ
jgi:hypothetical protein